MGIHHLLSCEPTPSRIGCEQSRKQKRLCGPFLFWQICPDSTKVGETKQLHDRHSSPPRLSSAPTVLLLVRR